MPAKTQQNDDQGLGMGQGLNVLYFLAKMHAANILVFLRRGAGTEWPGLPGIGALIVLLYAMGRLQTPWMTGYAAFWLVALAYRRLQTYGMSRRGAVIHSRYDGYPQVTAWLFGNRPENLLKTLEIGLVLVVGVT